MKIWLINDGENLPVDGENPRLQRMGLLAYKLADLGVEVTWWQSTLNHYKNKQYRFNTDTDVTVKENVLLKMIHSPIGYKKNVSLRRLAHQWHMAYKFYNKAKREEKPDLILCCMPTLEFLFFATKFAKKYNVPYVVDVRDLNPDVFLTPFHGFIRSVVKVGIAPMQWILTRGLQSAKAILATSEPYMDWALNYAKREKKKEDRVFYVAYPDCQLPSGLSKDSRWIKYANNKGLICCFFGQFGKIIDHESVFKTAEMCKASGLDVSFLLCGDGELLEHYKKLVKEKNLDNVELPGWVNQTDIRDIGFVSDIGLLSHFPCDAFNMQMPNKFSEYLALGLVIMLRPVGIMKEKLEANNCGLHYDSAEDLFEKLKDLSNDRNKLETMKKNSRTLFESSFASSVVNEEYANYLIELAKSNK